MTVTFRNTLCLIVVASCLVIFPCAAEKFDPKTFQTEASFDLVVSKSNYLKPGTRSIQCRNAIVSLVHGLVSGNSDGLEVMFFTRPIAEAALPDIMSNHARELMQGDYAAMVLLLDKENKVRQVNLSVVVPGTTVGRTVAWKPDELRKYFSQVTFSARRLVLKSKGSYSDTESGPEEMKLSWAIDLDLPVFREVKR